jgi:AcrR family transcriptional regulator
VSAAAVPAAAAAASAAGTGPADRGGPGAAGETPAPRVHRADEIRQAALELFARDGYDAASMRDLADAVGIRAASLYNHFGSKEDILWDLMQRAFEDLEAGWAQAELTARTPDGRPGSPGERLRAFYAAHVRYHALNRHRADLLNRQLHGLRPERYRACVALRDHYQAHLTRIVTDGVRSGEFAVPDVRLATFALLEMGMAVATWYRVGGAMDVDELCRRYVEMALKLVAPHEAATGPTHV